MFYIIRCIIGITVWSIFSDKKRWREILPVSFFASYLGVTTDLIMHHYKLWEYHGAHPLIIGFANNMVCYIIVPYIFIQWLPKEQNFKKLVPYVFYWTILAISIEFIHLHFGFITHHNGWTLLHSYVADWVLYFIFYGYYKLFKFYRLRH